MLSKKSKLRNVIYEVARMSHFIYNKKWEREKNTWISHSKTMNLQIFLYLHKPWTYTNAIYFCKSIHVLSFLWFLQKTGMRTWFSELHGNIACKMSIHASWRVLGHSYPSFRYNSMENFGNVKPFHFNVNNEIFSSLPIWRTHARTPFTKFTNS